MTYRKDKRTAAGQPLVSICVPVYNGEVTVIDTLRSVFNQTYTNMEIIAVDNASTDSTHLLLQQLDDPRLTIHRNERTIPAEDNFSRCVELASGDYIAVFHADDLYLPDMVAKQVSAFQSNSSLGAVFTRASRINADGKITGEVRFPRTLKGKTTYTLKEMLVLLLRYGNFLMCPSCIVNGPLYKKLMPLDYGRFGSSGDLDLWLRLMAEAPIAILGEKLMCYRTSRLQGSHRFKTVRTAEADFFKVMDHHLSVLGESADIPFKAIAEYEFQRGLDKIVRAANCLDQGEQEEARKLLRQIVSPGIIWTAVRNLSRPRLMAAWVLGLLLLGLNYLSLGSYRGYGIRQLFL